MQEIAGPSAVRSVGVIHLAVERVDPAAEYRPHRQTPLQRCTGHIEGDACSFGTPPVTGRCTQTPNGGPLRVSRSGGAPARRRCTRRRQATSGALATMSSCCLGTRSMCRAM